MARARTIQPHFPRSTSMSRVSREARLLFIQLWLVADDAGRLRQDLGDLAEDLYPADTDALMLLTAWLDELDRQGCIERYRVDGVEYLRIVRWRKHQKIDRPTRSRLPASPSEPRPPRETREAREESGKRPSASSSSGNARECAEGGGEEVSEATAATLMRDLKQIQRRAMERDVFASALRSTELIGKRIGFWKPKSKKDEEPAESQGHPRLTDIVR